MNIWHFEGSVFGNGSVLKLSLIGMIYLSFLSYDSPNAVNSNLKHNCIRSAKHLDMLFIARQQQAFGCSLVKHSSPYFCLFTEVIPPKYTDGIHGSVIKYQS